MDEMQQPELPYNGTEGFIGGSDTSRDRAMREVAEGKVSERQQAVLSMLEEFPDGLTWHELGEKLGLHHGQVSGSLSVLHKAGKIAQLRSKRDNCHPYIAMRCTVMHPLTELILTPSDTKAGRKRSALMLVVEAAKQVDADYTLETAAILRNALRRLDAIDNT